MDSPRRHRLALFILAAIAALAAGVALLFAGFVTIAWMLITASVIIAILGLLTHATRLARLRQEAARHPSRPARVADVSEGGPNSLEGVFDVRLEQDGADIGTHQLPISPLQLRLIHRGARIMIHRHPQHPNVVAVDWDGTERLADQPTAAQRAFPAPQCTQCGAALAPPAGAGTFTCPYCSAPNQLVTSVITP